MDCARSQPLDFPHKLDLRKQKFYAFSHEKSLRLMLFIAKGLKVCCDCRDLQSLSEYSVPLRGGECMSFKFKSQHNEILASNT